jgi:hypothetical protein
MHAQQWAMLIQPLEVVVFGLFAALVRDIYKRRHP